MDKSGFLWVCMSRLARKAAYLAYKDCSINHRRNGVYGAMFMAATISAAFVVDDPMEAVKIGLTEIPENCLFAEGIRWALDNKSQIIRKQRTKHGKDMLECLTEVH